MNKQKFSKFKLEKDELVSAIESLYDLECDYIDAMSSGEPTDDLESTLQSLRIYFSKVAELLFQCGAFPSREEAKRVINANPDSLQHEVGPDGVVPDDGLLNPDELAAGVIALMDANEYWFQAPIAVCNDDFDFALEPNCRVLKLTTDFDSLRLSGVHSLKDSSAERLLWVEGSVKEHRYRAARGRIEALLQEVAGTLIVLGLLRYFPKGARIVGPMSIGTNTRVNTGRYISSVVLRVSGNLTGLAVPAAANELENARSDLERTNHALRLFKRAFSGKNPDASAVRHACRMFLRVYDAWDDGEAAMFQSVTLEGLLLDKRQRDDLSARLQDAVAYWIGGTASQRQKTRTRISALYKARSEYVHNGELTPSKFDALATESLVREVLLKELRSLG